MKNKKIRIRKKKIVLHSSNQNGKVRQYIDLLKRYKKPLISAITLFVLLGILIACYGLCQKKEERSFKNSASLKTANFPYLELLPPIAHSFPFYSAPKPHSFHREDTNLKSFLKEYLGKESDAVFIMLENRKLAYSRTKQVLWRFSPVNHTKSEDFFIYRIAPDSFALITLLPEPEIDIKVLKTTLDPTVTFGDKIDRYLDDEFPEKYRDFIKMPKIQEALNPQIDLHHDAKANDKFRLVYEGKWYENPITGENMLIDFGNLLAVYYKQKDKEIYAFRYEENGEIKYFNKNGKKIKKRFSMSPVRYSRISSKYGKRRHPIYGYHQKHLGTDYVANLNQPVYAVGDGIVTIAKANGKGNNGNYVKIKHDERYQTQYLHLNKLALGIESGKYVKQNEIIGYAGTTGLSTGVHVCFRFWKDNQQVDHTKEAVFQDVQTAEQVENMDDFTAHKNKLIDLLRNK